MHQMGAPLPCASLSAASPPPLFFLDNAGGDGTEVDADKRVEALTELFHRKHEEAIGVERSKKESPRSPAVVDSSAVVDLTAEPSDDGTRPLPSADWKRITSQSRPGQFSYLHLPTGVKQARFPRGDSPRKR